MSCTRTRWLRPLCLFVFLGGLAPTLRAEGPPLDEALYAALLEPSLADDGRVSEAERQAILRTARGLLQPHQLAELERRIATINAGRPEARPVGLDQPQAAPAPIAAAPEVPCATAPPARFGGLLDGLSIGLGFNGSKDPQTLGIDAHNGGRAEVNWAFPVWRAQGLGVQAGAALNYERSAVRILEVTDGTFEREQYFFTAGVFQKTPWGLSWGVVHDWLKQDYYSKNDLTQWRAQVGYAVTARDEVGVWAATGDRGDVATLTGVPVELIGMQQFNLFWKHTWEHDIETKFWAGYVPRHSKSVFILGPEAASHGQLSYGAEIFVPLSDRVAIWGESNFVNPVNTGTVDAALGLAFYPGGKARSVRREPFGPLMRVANNATFSVDSKP